MLTNCELKKLFCGVLYFEETDDGYIWPQQYTKEQVEYFKGVSDFWYERSTASNSKTIEFITEAREVSFDYKLLWIGSPDTFELCVDGKLSEIIYVKDIEKEGRLTFSLPKGQKQVAIYLPADSTAAVKDFKAEDTVKPVKKKAKILWMGDSITQGFGPYRAAETYVSVANRILECDVLNQGIGGYVYDKNVLVQMGDYRPDRIVLSFGTNQYKDETMEKVAKYYEKLEKLYPDIPVLCITPIWRGDCGENYETFVTFCEEVKKICKKYKNVFVVDGFSLVPHLSEYFIDNLHPNTLGSVLYGRNLAEEIKRLKFV